MKFETFIVDRAGTIQIDGAHFCYQREDGRAVKASPPSSGWNRDVTRY